MVLSDIQIRNAKARAKQYKLSDGGGLYLLVTPDGRKYWRLKYRFLGKEKLLALGVYPDVKAAKAREDRDAAKRLLKEHQDPTTVRKQRRHAAKEASENTFEAITREWVEQRRHQWVPSHAARVLNSLENEIFPALGFRPISEITAPELLGTLRKVEARGALETAQRVLQRCDAIFRYGVVTGRCERSPAADLKGALKTPKHENRAALSAADLPDFLRKLDAYDGHLLTRLALNLQALTFVRPGELRGAEWSEIDLEAAEWRIPAERMKMRAPHIVPLSRQAVAALEQLRQLSGRGRFVFPNQTKSGAPISENTVLYALYRLGYHSRATGHGFRATASTILNEQGWRADAIERQLAHKERNKVRAAYHRSEYLEERRQMMQAWADYLDMLKARGKVKGIKRVAVQVA